MRIVLAFICAMLAFPAAAQTIIIQPLPANCMATNDAVSIHTDTWGERIIWYGIGVNPEAEEPEELVFNIWATSQGSPTWSITTGTLSGITCINARGTTFTLDGPEPFSGDSEDGESRIYLEMDEAGNWALYMQEGTAPPILKREGWGGGFTE